MVGNHEEIIEAVNIEEAMTTAEQKFNVDRDKLDIEYISKGNSGFLGIGKKPIIIKAKYKIKDGDNLETPDEAVDGSISIVNGNVLITDPIGLGKRPSIQAGQNVEIYVNGKKITDSTTLCANDNVHFEVTSIPGEASYDIEITKDKMCAYLIIKKHFGKKFKIQNVLPALHIEVSATPEEEIPIIPLAEVESALKKEKVIYGIKQQEIKNALNSRELEVKVVAAEGLLPAAGQEHGIVYTYTENRSANDYDEEQQYASPYAKRKIFSVEAGDILAVKHVPTNKDNGKNVAGEEIPYIEKEILVGKGIELIKDGTVAVASMPGRPVFEGGTRKILSVIPIHVIDRDVDIKVGNLNFNGDIYIKGSVTEGFKVEAKGCIDVQGDVTFASLYANRDIHIHKKALTANVQVGVLTDYQGLNKELNFLLERLISLSKAANLVKENLDEEKNGQLIQLLIDKKYHDLPKMINKFVAFQNSPNNELTIQATEVMTLLEQKLCNLGPLRIKNIDEIDSLAKELQKTIDEINYLAIHKANIVLDYAQNSVIHASGDITITGQGSLTSELKSGRSIFIPNGSVRGGLLSAYEKIEVAELGASSSAEINIKLLGNCILHAKKVHPSIVIEYGAQKIIIDRHCRNLKAYVNSEGFLEIEELKA